MDSDMPLLERLALLTQADDQAFAGLQAIYAQERGVKVPQVVKSYSPGGAPCGGNADGLADRDGGGAITIRHTDLEGRFRREPYRPPSQCGSRRRWRRLNRARCGSCRAKSSGVGAQPAMAAYVQCRPE
jgi:hypothetical protein